MKIVGQFYSSESMTPLKATKPIYALSGKENNTTDKIPASAHTILNVSSVEPQIHTFFFINVDQDLL